MSVHRERETGPLIQSLCRTRSAVHMLFYPILHLGCCVTGLPRGTVLGAHFCAYTLRIIFLRVYNLKNMGLIDEFEFYLFDSQQ